MLLQSQEICFWMEACAWQGVGHGVDVWGQHLGGSDLASFLHMWGGVIPASAYKQGTSIMPFCLTSLMLVGLTCLFVTQVYCIFVTQVTCLCVPHVLLSTSATKTTEVVNEVGRSLEDTDDLLISTRSKREPEQQVIKLCYSLRVITGKYLQI